MKIPLLHPVFVALAKRLNPDKSFDDGWWFEGCLPNTSSFKCYICNTILKLDLEQSSALQVKEHGLKHLKEQNLLPFL